MTYEMKSAPFAKHQEDALEWLTTREQGAILLPMGTGKTYIMLAHLALLKAPTLVVSPLSVLHSWEKEIHEHTTATCTVVSGPRREKLELLRSNTDFTLINYDYFSRYKKVDDPLFKRFQTVILDESTRIKSPRAKRTGTIIRLFKNVGRKYILTGTPITRDYGDVFSQWMFMDGGRALGSNYFHFQRAYFSPVDYGRGRRSWEANKRTAASISKRISGSYFYRKKSDCLDLPPKIYERAYYHLAGDQHRVYTSLLKDWLAEIGSASGGNEAGTDSQEGDDPTIVTVNNALARDTKLRQLCSGYMNVENELIDYSHDKYKVVKEVVTESIPSGAQCVVWHVFTEEGRRIVEALRENNVDVEWINGQVPVTERKDILSRFERKHVRVVVAQIQTCAYGINEFRRCEYAIYAGQTYDYDLRAQSEDRFHRKGSVASCTYIDVVGQGTIEETILEVLDMKQRMTPSVFRNKVKELMHEQTMSN